jgi:pimeloyl-ACP methyl ester carboxylesterase
MRMRSFRYAFWMLMLASSLWQPMSGTASDLPPTQSTANVRPSQSCTDLRSADFTHVEDAPAQVLDVAVIDAGESSPAYCRVQGYVLPQVRFEIRLPTSNWNGKLLEAGDGGWGGEMYLFFCSGPLRKGYACIASDMGHTGASGLALWARNNIQAQIDFGYRATHVTALIGKALVNAYYGRPADKALMYGCSTGGYQGMVEAQRFPWDFDGIVAISPDMGGEADVSMRIVWKMQQLTDKSGQPIFRSEDLELLHNAALQACDRADGLKDGIIGDPVGCRFDPAVLSCRSGQRTGCLTPLQVRAAKNIYAGPSTAQGLRISTRGVFPGSELDWNDTKNPSAEVSQFFKYMLPDSDPNWKMADFNFDHDYQRLGLGAVYTDNNPDLRSFKAAGAKLIVAQGGNDTLQIPGAIFDYYDTVTRIMGGTAATQDFFRLFVIPGMKHCSGGDGAFAVDYLSYLEDWVENHHAPDRIVGAHVETAYLLQHSEDDGASIKDRVWLAALKLPFPLDPAAPVSFSRPAYPYPMLTKYKGRGDPNDPASFEPSEPVEAAQVVSH